MGSVFRFKKFEVNQEGCAMKINTDGVLLGALVQGRNPTHILDIGTGTGVIALMLAQRFVNASVDAVEIDKEAFGRAVLNFEKSSFSSRIKGFLGSFEDFAPVIKYDLIVSNPPFYTNSLHNPDQRKKLARHTDLRFFDKLLHFSHNHLSTDGKLNLILPVELADYVIAKAKDFGLSLVSSVDITSFEDSEVIRKIITLGFGTTRTITPEFFNIYKEKGVYSEAYCSVLKPFFLAF